MQKQYFFWKIKSNCQKYLLTPLIKHDDMTFENFLIYRN